MMRGKDAVRLLIAVSLTGLEIALPVDRIAIAQDVAVCETETCDSCDGLPISDGCDGFSVHRAKQCIWTRDTLTGDWGGQRTALKESGITFAGRSTHFGFGVEGGIQAPPPVPLLGLGDTFKYTGRGEYDLIFDLEKFGGLPKGTLLARAEHWYGEYGNVSLRTGAFPPAVFPAALPPTPQDPGQIFLSNFVVTQPLSPELVVYAGKIDVVGGVDQDDFAGGDGTTQFMNQALIANPAFLLGLPYSSFTAGVVLPREWGRMTTYVLDPQNRIKDFFEIDDLFSQGVIVGGEIKRNTQFFDKKGDIHVGGIWKHVDQTDLRFNEPPPGVYPQPVVPGFATLSNAYTIYIGGDQYFVQFADKPERGYGLFTRASISDGNPTPIQYFLSAGLGGYSPIRQERGDKFGLGWYYIGASNEFGPLPQAVFGPRDGTGVELFYSFQTTPWMSISPDVQYIKPEAGRLAEDAFVYGVRVNAVF
ncbi:MAG: carbohydrate porin [Planctomycetes bacterium]|nr:carbohydrate porin [Planctomycetota bacterium]